MFNNFFQRIGYTFSSLHMEEIRHRMEHMFRYVVINRKCIHLAVVGTTSSGKSFLLNDILASLRNMGGTFKDLRSDTLLYKTIVNYSPDESGGHGRTPIYACRRTNFYGTYVKHNNGNNDKYDLVFINIPGEIFMQSTNGKSTRLRAYLDLKSKIAGMKKKFFVTTWTNAADELRYIVQPVENCTATENDLASTVTVENTTMKIRYMDWSEIFGDLNSGGFKACKGSKKKISGATLLKNFFEYDTDSVMMSLRDMLFSKQIRGIDFNHDDFRARDYDKCFTFFHYCSRASDIVLCDRIFTMDKTEGNEMSFGEMSRGLSSFLDNCGNNQHINVYLSFRNVDYLLQHREQNYKKLHEEVLNNIGKEKRRNAIYSIFNYVLLHHYDKNFTFKKEEFLEAIGLSKDDVKDDALITADIEKLTNSFIDLTGGKGVVYEASDLLNHIKTRLGDCAHAFGELLQSAGCKNEIEEEPYSLIVPHVYYTCTPVTQDYDVFHNYYEGDSMATDFCKEVNGKRILFEKQNSNACFGSYQLCMDILTQHDLGEFEAGILLKTLQNVN